MTSTTRPQAEADRPLTAIRLDLFLKLSRLIPRRSLAKEVCDHGGITVNGVTAKSSRLVHAGDSIEWRQSHRVTCVKVAKIPGTRPRKAEADALYESVRTEDGQRTAK